MSDSAKVVETWYPPSCCSYCRHYRVQVMSRKPYSCDKANGKAIQDDSANWRRMDWCPLRRMPEKKSGDTDFDKGYNQCIEDILSGNLNKL